MAAPTDLQRRKLVNEMESAFKQYAELYGSRVHVGALTDSIEVNQGLIKGCGAEFKRILQDETDWEDAAAFTEDLFNLTDRGCPKLDIIDLMFWCTTGRNLSIRDTLADLDLSDSILLQLRIACAWCADRISVLNMPQAQGPLHFLPELVPEMSPKDRTRLVNDLHKLPDMLHIFSDLLKMYPPKKVRTPEIEAWGQDGHLALFYLMIHSFNFGYPTLSFLLRTMRRVRYTVSPKAKYVRQFRRVGISRKEQRGVRDPLSELALQRRLFRFFKRNPSIEVFSAFIMSRYLSAEYTDRRASGATLMTSFPDLIKSN